MKTNNMTNKREQITALRQRYTHVDRHRAPWTSDELNQLQTMFDEGVGITEMALTLQRSELAIFNQVKGLYRRIRPPKEEKMECKCPSCPQYSNCRHNGHS